MKKFLIFILGIILISSCIRQPQSMREGVNSFAETVESVDSLNANKPYMTYTVWFIGANANEIGTNLNGMDVRTYNSPTKWDDGLMAVRDIKGNMYSGIIAAKRIR